MSEPTEREDLEQLQTSPGWLRFAEYVRHQWGPIGYGQRLKRAVTQAMADKTDIALAVASVDAANNAVNEVLSYPQQRINQLLAMEANVQREKHPPLSRRGTL
jgi:hypothetical protein